MSFNLAVILSETAHAAPDRPVAIYDGGRLTYRELDHASDLLSAALAASGIEPGDRVALQLPNIPQFLISYFGILKAGAVVVPLNVLLRAPEVAFHLSDSGARVLITWDGSAGRGSQGRRGRRGRDDLRGRASWPLRWPLPSSGCSTARHHRGRS